MTEQLSLLCTSKADSGSEGKRQEKHHHLSKNLKTALLYQEMATPSSLYHVFVWKNLCTFTLSAAFASSHKVLWHSDINQVAGMTGGWGSFSLIRLCGDAPCPHPQLLQQHLFTSSGLSVWKAALSLSMSQTHTWRTHTQHTHKGIWLVLGGGWVSPNMYAPNALDPYWFLALLSLIRQLL